MLRLVGEGRLNATSSVEVVQEILHRFLAGAHRAVGVEMAELTLDVCHPVLGVDETVKVVPQLHAGH